MPFQCIQQSEAASAWLDVPGPDMGLGFLEATKLRVERVTPDLIEGGDAWRVTLLAGLWPSEQDLALMVLGYSPGSPEAASFLGALEAAGGVVMVARGTTPSRLTEGTAVMPALSGSRQRMVFVTGAFESGPGAAQTAQLTKQEPAGQRPDQMGYDQWRLMVDLELHKHGATLTGEEDEAFLREVYDDGDGTPESAALNVVEGRRLDRVDAGAHPGGRGVHGAGPGSEPALPD